MWRSCCDTAAYAVQCGGVAADTAVYAVQCSGVAATLRHTLCSVAELLRHCGIGCAVWWSCCDTAAYAMQCDEFAADTVAYAVQCGGVAATLRHRLCSVAELL